MAKNGFKVFDSDMHIMEPPDLWERYIAPEFRPSAPRGRTSENVRDLGLIFPNASPATLRTRGTCRTRLALRPSRTRRTHLTLRARRTRRPYLTLRTRSTR